MRKDAYLDESGGVLDVLDAKLSEMLESKVLGVDDARDAGDLGLGFQSHQFREHVPDRVDRTKPENENVKLLKHV